MLENVRMDALEKNALLNALHDIDEEVYLFGSRLDLKKKGGDIDILVFSKENNLNLSKNISRKFFLECEEKIDVLVFDKDKLSDDQKAFIDSIQLLRIK